jgi:magnesium transporter
VSRASEELPLDQIEELVELVRSGQISAFAARARDVDPADLAVVFTNLDEKERVAAVRALPPELSGEALVEMPAEEHAGETLAALPSEYAAHIVEELEDDDAADILGDLEPAEQERILSEVEDRADVKRLLRYDQETAGGRMTTHLVKVRHTDTVGQALDEIRRQSEEVEDFYEVFVVDANDVLVGTLPLKQLVTSALHRPIREFVEEAEPTVPPDLDQEEVARLMARYDLPSVPVVDPSGRLLGRVTFDDVTDVVQEEATEDLLQFGGVSPDEALGAEWLPAVKSRLPWLYVNLLTAFAAGGVVLAFQGTVERIAVLAAWMPIIAGMGGNAGTQALAVTVRRLALGLVPPGEFGRAIGKEALVGVVNGLAIGVAVAIVAAMLGQGWKLGLVVFLAMTGNLLVAGFAGAFIPVLLERGRVDPAIASSIFVTTFTDVCGFALLLGLASRFLL